MKKIIALLLVMTLFAFMLVSCGDKEEPTTTAEETKTVETNPTLEETEPPAETEDPYVPSTRETTPIPR